MSEDKLFLYIHCWKKKKKKGWSPADWQFTYKAALKLLLTLNPYPQVGCVCVSVYVRAPLADEECGLMKMSFHAIMKTKLVGGGGKQ